MFSSLLSIVDSVLTLDEGCSRKDILSGDQVIIEGNLNKNVIARISGAASLTCIHGANKSKKFFIIVGKHKLGLQGNMDMNPKPLSMVCTGHKSIRVTNDQNKYFEVRFNDSVSFGMWLQALGEALAESICSDVLISQDASNRIVCSNMRRCIHTCELLTSPSKVYIRRVNEIYGIRRKLLEVMSTLRSNPCDVNMKDLRSLRELCWKYPELQTDPDMKFLLERMPSDRYNSEDLQVILKDIMYTESEDINVVCAQVYHGDHGVEPATRDSASAVASAVLVNACDTHSIETLISVVNAEEPSTKITESVRAELPDNSTSTTSGPNQQTTRAVVPVHKKSRIVLNGVEIQSSTRSPSSAGKALSKQIKIKSKFTTPSHRKEAPRPKSKTKTPPPSMDILSEIKFQVIPSAILGQFSSPEPVPAQSSAAHQLFSPVSVVDKENMPVANKNITPAPPKSALKMPTSVSAAKSTPAPSLIPIRAKSPLPVISAVPEKSEPAALPVESPISTETARNPLFVKSVLPSELSVDKSTAIELIPAVLDRRQSHFGSPMNPTTMVPFFSPSNQTAFLPDVANLFDDAIVYAVAAQESRTVMSCGERQFTAKTPTMALIKPKNADKCTTSEKNTNKSGVKSSLIPTYDVSVLKVEPLSTHPVTKPSKLPVAVERASSASGTAPLLGLDSSAVQNELQEERIMALQSPSELSEPSSKLVIPSTSTPCSVNSPLTPQASAPPSAARESRDKKIKLAQSLMSPAAKPLRVKHFTQCKQVVGEATANQTPRTPAQAATTLMHINSPVQMSAPAPSSPCILTECTVQMNLEEKKEVSMVRNILPIEKNDIKRGATRIIAIITIICVVVAASWGSTTIFVIPASSIAPVQNIQSPSPLSALSMSQPIVTAPAELQASHTQTLQTNSGESLTSTVEYTIPSVQANGFEMHVRFESDSSLSQPTAVDASSANPVSPRVAPPSQPQTQTQAQRQALQRHTSSALRTHLRRLQRLLSLPVKLMRSLFGKAFQKFDRVRRVLAE